MYKERIKRVREEIDKQKVDAILVSCHVNVEYLTGFSGTFGYVLINSSDVCLFTDSRYYERCKKETKGIKVRLIEKGWLSKYKIKRLGFESCSVDYNTYRKWKRSLKNIKLVATVYLVEQIRMVKHPEEIKLIRNAIRITEDVLRKVKRQLKTGVAEVELAQKIERWMSNVADTVPAFGPIVAYGTNSSMPHAGLSKKRLLNKQLALIDLGAKFKGYSSDLTRTFLTGKITRKFKEVYNIVLTAQRKAIENVGPGRRISEVDSAARDYIKKCGYARYFGHPVGHGIGKVVHEIPRVDSKNQHYLKPGMIFSVEPGVYIPGWGGVRIEDMVLVTDKGCEVLTSYSRQLDEITINVKR